MGTNVLKSREAVLGEDLTVTWVLSMVPTIDEQQRHYPPKMIAYDEVQLDVFNAEAKKIDKKRLCVVSEFHTDLKSKVDEIYAHE